MRRRAVLAGLPLGVLGLAACGPEQDGADASPSVPPVEQIEPVQVGERAEVVAYTELRLPLEMTPMVVVDPVERRPAPAGRHLPRLSGGGPICGSSPSTRTAPCCGGRTVRSAAPVRAHPGRRMPVAVLADLAEAAAEAARHDLTGYDLRTAELLWGRSRRLVQAAPGLVHAAAAAEPEGEGGPRRCPAPPGPLCGGGSRRRPDPRRASGHGGASRGRRCGRAAPTARALEHPRAGIEPPGRSSHHRPDHLLRRGRGRGLRGAVFDLADGG